MLTPEGFKPSLSPQQVKNFRRLYEQNPNQFNDQSIESLKHHAEYYKLPFAESNKAFLEQTKDAMKQVGAGFFEGFTTFKADDPPTNDVEAIARNLGHLAGFVGYIPGFRAARGMSAPMIAAKYAEKGVKKITKPIQARAIEARAAAGKTATGFLQNNVVGDIASGAFHLGVASAVSSWQGGVDEMMDAFKHGAIAGGAFRGIGNLVQTGDKAADTALKTLAGSLFTGLPSTLRGETTPMQIYQYVLGAYFGKNELPVHRRMGMQHLVKMRKKNITDPELVEGWNKIDQPGKDFVIRKVKEAQDPVNRLAADILQNTKGITPEQARIEAEKLIKKEQELEAITFTDEGEPLKNLTKQERKEMELSGEDVDPQNIPERLSINAKSFVDRNMSGYLEGKTKGEKLNVATELNDKWLELIKKGREEKRNPAGEMLDFIAKKHPEFSSLSEDRAFWKGLGFMRVKQRPVNMITMTNGNPRVMVMDETGSAINDAGNRKMLSQQPKVIEEIFLTDYNKKHGLSEKNPTAGYAILDHVVRGTPTGIREFEINKYQDYLAQRIAAREGKKRPDAFHQQKAIEQFNREIGNLMGFMHGGDKKMYFYGGRGDADRMYFVKYHPETPLNKTDIKNSLKQIKDAMRQARDKKGKRLVSEEDIKSIETSRKEYIKKYSKGIGSKELAGKIFDRAYISNAIYDAKLNGFRGLEDIGKVFGGGYINNAKAFNKRSQIWFTSGYSSEPEAIITSIEKARKGKADIENNEFNIRLVNDLAKQIQQKIGTPNSKLFPAGDGAIYGRSDVIDALNSQAGLPIEGGVNKSFIVSKNPELGALLGKYMIHSVTPKMEAYMQKNNIHMIIPKSSAKQLGERKLGKLEWYKNNPRVIGEKYKLPIEDVKVIMSEKTDKHYIEPQRMLKQMFTNFTPFAHFDPARTPFKTEKEYNEAMGKTLDNMYQELSGKRIEGDLELNKKLEIYSSDPVKNERLLKELVDNIDNIGVHELLQGIKKPGNEKFANEVYAKIHKLNRDVIEQMRADGEYTDKQLEQMKNEMSDFETVHERVSSLIPDSLAGFLHKFNRDYRASVVRNYLISSITRPTIANSASSRMRPYEIGMFKEGETKILEKRDDVFFLDDGFKKMMVDVTGLGKKGKRPLGELWKEYVDGGKKDKQLEELFRALVVRVPMDSMSGANVLRFYGFTGIRGFGSLLHGRTMESLGGADLDGDKAFIFFGGKSADGKGGGFKKEWKDAYDWSRNEFVKNGMEEHNKDTKNPLSKKGETYREELTVQGDLKHELGSNVALQYSPLTRQKASNAASQGRMQLGTAVTQSAYVRSAYSAIRSMPNGQYFTEIYVPELKRTLRLRIKAKKGVKNLRSFRGVSRAAVGLASDPMDEAGLNFGKYGEKLLKKQTDALFDYTIVDKKGKPMLSYNRHINDFHKKSVISNIRNINQAVYSRNWAENRRFNMWEIQEKLESIDNLRSGILPENRNTFLPKLATDLKGLDWGDSVISRLNKERILDIYKKHEDSLPELDAFRDILGRTSMAVPRSPYLDLVLKHRLHTRSGMQEQLDINNKEYSEKILSGEAFKSYNKRKDFNPNDVAQRKRYLNEILAKAEDFVVNDFSDIASIKVLSRLAKDIPTSRIRELAGQADYLKKNSYVLSKRSREIDRSDATLDPIEIAYLEAAQEAIYGEKQSQSLNQAKIDSSIRRLKKGYTTEEANFFDALMLGTLWRGRKFDREAFVKKFGEPKSEKVRKEFEDMLQDSKKTTLTRVGYASDSIPDVSVRRMLKEYEKLYETATEKVDTQKEIKNAEKASEEFAKVIEDPEITPEQRKRIDEYEPFIGLNKGKLSKAEAELALSIKGHLKHYNNITSVDLNGLMRWLVKKDLNAASLNDFKTLDRWFQMTKDGTWWQRIMRPAKDNKVPISRWHWLMFPKAIGADTLRYDLKLMDQRAPFKNKEGEWITSTVRAPESTITRLQNAVHITQQQATQFFEEQKREFDRDLRPYLESIPEGDKLFRIAVREREYKHEPARIKAEIERIGGDQNTYNLKSKEYFDKWAEIQKEYNWAELQNKTFDVTLGGGRIVKMNGRKIVDKINKVLTEWNQKVHGWLTGGRDANGINEWDRSYKQLRDTTGHRGDYLVVEKFLKKMDKAMLEGKRIDLSEGIDGLRELAKSQMISYFPKAQDAVKKSIAEGLSMEPTGFIEPKGYWPHLSGDPKIAAQGLKKVIKELTESPFIDKEARKKELAQAIYHYRQITGDYTPTGELNDKYNLASEVLKDIATKSGKKEKNLRGFTDNKRIGSQHKREAHIPGWSVEPEVYSQYMKNAIDNMYRHAAQIKVRSDIYKFQKDSLKKHNDPKYTFEWVDFYNLYAQDALGYPQNLPKSILENPNMKIKGTPFAWWNDTNVKNRVNSIRDKLGIGKKKDAELPKELRGIDFGTLAKWGNLEAKYQLATLLAHPKSAVANLYGGSVHTLISTGLGNFRNARNIKYLQANVNPEWNNIRDVEKWVQSLGVVEDFILYEAGLNPKFQGQKFKGFMEEAVRQIKKDPNLPDTDLRQIARKYGIGNNIFNKAAWFMRRPERTLRRDAFMAHYLQARNNFEGAITRFDDPILIKMGMEGVKSTQFLYSAPFRPAFARSTMGKMMTRFQLWAWNSVRFRKDIMREAKLYGYKEGTPEFERYKRMAAMDLMMFGLANVFMYSLFENTLPQPYAWMQDMSDWAFGNDKERSRAFFGTYPTALAPLQAITPPGLRALPPLFKWMINDDSVTNASYITWSMFPFGRMGYDIFGKGGIIDNPTRGIEKLTGFPYQQGARQVKKYKDEEMLYPEII